MHLRESAAIQSSFRFPAYLQYSSFGLIKLLVCLIVFSNRNAERTGLGKTRSFSGANRLSESRLHEHPVWIPAGDSHRDQVETRSNRWDIRRRAQVDKWYNDSFIQDYRNTNSVYEPHNKKYRTKPQ